MNKNKHKGFIHWWLIDKKGFEFIRIIFGLFIGLTLMLVGPSMRNDIMVIIGFVMLLSTILGVTIVPMMIDDYRELKKEYKEQSK